MAMFHVTCLKRMTGDQRKLLLLMVLLAALTQAEYVYGFLSLDVRAVADSVQATLHIVSLVVSFCAIDLSSWEKDDAFSYGYERTETLAAFTNCCFIVFECAFVAVHNLHDTIVWGTGGNASHPTTAGHGPSQLVRICAWRCVVNVLGLVLFASELRDMIRRSKHHPSATIPAHTENVSSIVLKLFTSTSSSLVAAVAEPGMRLHRLLRGLELPLSLCSGALAVYLALPLLLATGQVLLLAIPLDVQPALDKCLREVSFTDGILEVLQWSFWPVTGSQTLVGAVSVRIRSNVDREAVVKSVKSTCSRVCRDLTVQVMREQPLDALLADRQKAPVRALV